MIQVHGGLPIATLRALGIDPEGVLDMSVNVNPYGPCRAVREAVASARIERYPDPGCTAAREAVAAAQGVSPGRVLLGNGATELLWALVATFGHGTGTSATAGRRGVLTAEPLFGEVARACAAHGVEHWPVWTQRDTGEAPAGDPLPSAVRRHRPALVYLCNPGTPVGGHRSAATLRALAAGVAPGLLVVDESFLSLSDGHGDAGVALPDNVVRIRSLTKDHTVPGVRIGYALAQEVTIEALRARLPAWSVSAAAQAVAAVACDQTEFIASCRARLRRDRLTLAGQLREVGLRPLPSTAPYLCFPHANPAALQADLLRSQRVLVRDCTSFGLRGLLRVSVRGGAERAQLMDALATSLRAVQHRGGLAGDGHNARSLPT